LQELSSLLFSACTPEFFLQLHSLYFYSDILKVVE
jgi:hypothetical protein